MSQTPAQRQQKRRDKQKASGLQRVEVWVPPYKVAEIREIARVFAENLQAHREFEKTVKELDTLLEHLDLPEHRGDLLE